MDLNLLWRELAQPLTDQFSPINYALWIGALSPVSYEDGILTLASPTEINRNYFIENYKEAVESLLSQTLERSVSLEIRVSQGSDHVLDEVIEVERSSMETPSSSLDREALLTLDDFVAGPENQFPLQAARQVVEHPGKWNPLFIYGRSGVGKTHLLKGILNEYILRGREVKYLAGHQFYNLYFSATQNRSYDNFYALFKGIDLLIIDDIQFFQGKIKTQETFFHIFNSLYESGAQIVLAADRKPSAISGLEVALLSRLNWGLLVEIEHPEAAARRIIVERLSGGLKLSGALLDHFASLPFETIRELEGFVVRLRARCEFQALQITKELIDEEFSRVAPPRLSTIHVEDVKEAVCKYFDLTKKELVSQKRVKRIARPRQVAMYLAKKHTSKTLPQIGDSFGRKAHSTVHSACAKIDDLRDSDTQLTKDINEIERLLDI